MMKLWAFAFYYGWQLALVILAAGPILIGGSYLRARLVFNFTQSARERFEKATQDSLEAIIHVRTVAAFTSEPKVLQTFSQAIIFNRDQVCAPHCTKYVLPPIYTHTHTHIHTHTHTHIASSL